MQVARKIFVLFHYFTPRTNDVFGEFGHDLSINLLLEIRIKQTLAHYTSKCFHLY